MNIHRNIYYWKKLKTHERNLFDYLFEFVLISTCYSNQLYIYTCIFILDHFFEKKLKINWE